MKHSTKTRTEDRRNYNNTFWMGLLTVFLIVGMAGLGCEGPSGSEGESGPEGPEGPVGPAGEDGSQMYAADGEPGSDIGDEGDFYLDQETGDLYGPKDSDGWGDPGVVLMGEDGEDGEDGSDGQDGADGQDGEDGSEIHSGSGEPDAELGAKGDFYLDEDESDLYGPKTDSGWGSPLDLKGADGNANVTRYIFPGHDFSSNSDTTLIISEVDSSAMRQSSWNTYLVRQISIRRLAYDHVPGINTSGDSYSVLHGCDFCTEAMEIFISLEDGAGTDYEQIEVVRIEANNTEDNSKRAGGDAIIPEDLDVSDYEEVAKYYGFWR